MGRQKKVKRRLLFLKALLFLSGAGFWGKKDLKAQAKPAMVKVSATKSSKKRKQGKGNTLHTHKAPKITKPPQPIVVSLTADKASATQKTTSPAKTTNAPKATTANTVAATKKTPAPKAAPASKKDPVAKASDFELKAPLHKARVSSPFGFRHHPVLHKRKLHKGMDFAAKKGTPIKAAADGVIVLAQHAGGYGKYVLIKHKDGYSTGYAHLSRYHKGIKAGTKVTKGMLIGYVGNTGRSTGAHLHFELIKNGRHINPKNFLST
ncbi:MAG: M23 family metallopeptidase [Holosporaceae bacterium]